MVGWRDGSDDVGCSIRMHIRTATVEVNVRDDSSLTSAITSCIMASTLDVGICCEQVVLLSFLTGHLQVCA